MFSSLVLGSALLAPAAPVPAESSSNPTGPAPRVAFLKGDANGNVSLYGYTIVKQKVTQSRQVVENGQLVIKQEQVEVMNQVYFQRQLSESSTKITTADGTPLTGADAVNRVKAGAAVLISSDGKPVDKAWLRVVGSDTVVVSSDQLANAILLPQGTGNPTTAAPRLVLLAADAEGKVTLAYNPTSGDAPGYDEDQIFVNRGNGGIMVMNARARRVGFDGSTSGLPAGQTAFPGKLLDDVKFDAFDLKGNTVPRGEAMKRLKAGGYVLIAGDGRLPDAEYLKPFQGDLLVLVSSELVLPPGATIKAQSALVKPNVGAVAPVLKVAPVAPLPAAKPLQVQPLLVRPAGGLRVAPVPVPAQEEKPVEKAPAPKKD